MAIEEYIKLQLAVKKISFKDAAEWLEEKIKNTTPEDEIIFCVASEKFFDVYIFFGSPTSYVV